LIENFPYNLIGIGIGTPLLPYYPNAVTTDLGHPDEYIAHVIGAHNTFITLFSRFGIGFILLMIMIYRAVFREFYWYKSYYLNHKNDISLFLAFFTITTVGIFNLLLETPTLAAVYWVFLGFVAAAIHERKINQNEL
jgi:O-antigen ligase